MNDIENILAILNPSNTMSINRLLAHAIGLNETVVYAALISKHAYYQSTGKLTEDGWFFSTIPDLQESTTFGRKAQVSAINNLVLIGLIECELRGMPARRYFRISDDPDLIMRLISEGTKIAKNICQVQKPKSGRRDMKRMKSVEETGDVENVLDNVESGFEETAQDSSLYPAAQTSMCPSVQTSLLPSAQTSLRPVVQTSLSLPDTKTKENKTKEIKNDLSLSSHSLSDAREEKFSDVDEVSEGDEAAMETNAFCEMLAEMGVRSECIFLYEPKSESDLSDFDNEERDLDVCRIPHSFHSNRQLLTEAIRYMSSYSYFWQTEPDSSQAQFHSCCVNVLADMISEDSVRVNGVQVMYYTIIDKINVLANRDLLADAFFDFTGEWKKVVSGRQISDRKKYFSSCLWKWLDEYEFHRSSESVGEF